MEITTTKEIITKETEEDINNNKDKDKTTNKDRCNKEPKILTKAKTNNSLDNSNLRIISNSSPNSQEHNNNLSNNHKQLNLNNLNNHNNLNNKLHSHSNKYLSIKPFNSLSKEKMLS